MERPRMNEARMAACMKKKGMTRAKCMKMVYPEGEPMKGGKKQAPPVKKGGY